MDNGNNKIENIYIEEDIVGNYLHHIDSSIDNNIKLRFNFNISEDGREITKLKEYRRRDTKNIIPNNETQIPSEMMTESLAF